MFRNLLKPDNPLMIMMSQITDCIFLSLFFIVACVPVVTTGAAVAALYDSVYRGFRAGEKHTWQRFLHTFRQNWKIGIVPTVIFLICCAALGKGMISIWNAAVYETISWAAFSGLALVGVVLVGVLSVLFPMLSRFENPLGALLKNTVVLSLANLPRTLILGMLNTAALLLSLRYIFPLFFAPALAALIGSLLIEPMFKPYLPDEPEEAIEEAAE